MIQTVATLLLPTSALTTITVEMLKDNFKNASPNLLVIIVSIVVGFFEALYYLISNELSFGVDSVVFIFMVAFVNFLSSTIGYDKVKQLLEQMKK